MSYLFTFRSPLYCQSFGPLSFRSFQISSEGLRLDLGFVLLAIFSHVFALFPAPVLGHELAVFL